MEDDLLVREREYHEINKKLEQRARELLQKVDCVKSGNDFSVHAYSQSHLANHPSKLNDRRCKSVSSINRSEAKFSKEELQTLHLPEDINNVGAKGFVHFLKSKVKQLQFELDKTHKELRVKNEELGKAQRDNSKLHEDKLKLLQQSNIARSQISKLENQATVVQSKLQAKDGEILGLKKEVDSLNRELKNVSSQSKGNEAKFQRALDELGKLKLSLKSMKEDEKNLKDAHKRHTNSLHDAISRLEKQKTELLQGFKRQYVLVDNLKRQKSHLEAMKINEKIEADFINMVSQDSQK